METIVSVEKLCKSYDQFQAVTNLDISIARGEVYGLLGANGAGKSTTIECILGTRSRTAAAYLFLVQIQHAVAKIFLKKLESNFRRQIIKTK